MGSRRKKRRPICATKEWRVLCCTVTPSSPQGFPRPCIHNYLSLCWSLFLDWHHRVLCLASSHCGKRETFSVCPRFPRWYLSQLSPPPSYGFSIGRPVLFSSQLPTLLITCPFRSIHSSPCLSCSLLSQGSVMYASICVDYLSFSLLLTTTTTIPHSLALTQTRGIRLTSTRESRQRIGTPLRRP